MEAQRELQSLHFFSQIPNMFKIRSTPLTLSLIADNEALIQFLYSYLSIFILLNQVLEPNTKYCERERLVFFAGKSVIDVYRTRKQKGKHRV